MASTGTDVIPFTREELARSIPGRFETIVGQVSDRTALAMDPEVVSYGRLNDAANRLARTLVAHHGSKPEAVGVLLGRGVSLPVAMLAVLKAGKFFVLLDPAFPTARIASMLADCEAEILITDRRHRDIADGARGDSRVVLDVEPIDAADGNDLGLPIAASSLACIIYTSGSTGQPKGVVLDHAALLHNAMLQGIVNSVRVRDRVSLLTAATANAISTTFFTLLSGAALLPFDVANEGLPRLAQWLAAGRISVAVIAAPLFRRFCESLRGDETFPDLRLIRLTSENAYATDIDLFKKHFPSGCALINGLNSTETGPIAANTITDESTLAGNDVPVGYALLDKEIVLLDEAGEEVGPNETGEIAVRSRYLSRGYWRRTELTASRFRPDRMDGTKRVYLTGDLGLMLPDGRLVHKGRKDFRLKIRGYGVDVAEVQKTLAAHPAVSDAVIIPSKNDVGESRLVAFFTSRVRPAPDVTELRAFLKQHLASYMVPSHFVTLDALPLTANGKLDRRALTMPEWSRPDLKNPHAPATTATEAKLVSIMGSILDVHPIGIHDDFFDLGGDSLAATALVTALAAEFNVDIPIGDLVSAPTIERLARQIEAQRTTRTTADSGRLVQLQPGNSHTPIVFFVPGGIGGDSEFFVYARLVRHIGSEYPVYGLKARSADGTESSQASVEEMASDYVRAIQSMQPTGPYYVIGECSGGIVAYEIAQRLRGRGEELGLLLLMDTPRPDFSLEVRRRVTRWLEPILTDTRVMGLSFLWSQLRQRTAQEKVRYLIAKRGRIIDRTLAPRPLPGHQRTDRAIAYVQRSYSRAIYAYRAKPYPGKMTLLVHEDFERAGDEPTLGWKGLVAGGIESRALVGNHTTYIRDHVHVAAKEIREALERARLTT